jgi:diacylglycerol kinase (ATP)
MGRLPARQIRADIPPPRFPSRGRGLWQSVVHAWSGLIHTVVAQRNMRIHVTAAVLVSLVGSGIPLGLAEKVTLIFCVLFMFFAEILNSALEHLVDLAVQEVDENARTSKDAAAAGVLVLAIGTVVIFAAILVHNWEAVTSHGPEIRRQVLLGIPVAATCALLMMDVPRPPALDAGLFLIGCGLLAVLASWSTSYVFSSMTFGLLIVAGDSARLRRKLASSSKPR